MSGEEIEDVINQIEKELQEVFTVAGVSENASDTVDGEQLEEINFIGNVLNTIYDDNQNSSSRPAIDLRIVQQPQGSFHFRFISQIKSMSGGNLYGRRGGTGRMEKNYPRIELQSCNISAKYFVRCTLHQAQAAGESMSFCSPHLLYRRDGKGVKYAEMEMFPFNKDNEVLHSFTLENVTIVRTARKDWHRVLLDKMKVLQQKVNNEDLVRIANEQVQKPQNKVRLCFEVFQCTNMGYEQVGDAIYSECISNGKPPRIELCNKSGAISELLIVTLKVSSVKPKDIIHIYHVDENSVDDYEDNDNIDGDGGDNASSINYNRCDWSSTVTVEKEMIHEQSAVTFRMPTYRGYKYNKRKDMIKCYIQLERCSDGARSNNAVFHFIDTKKRRRRHCSETVIGYKKIQSLNSCEKSLTHFQSMENKSQRMLEELYGFYNKSRNMDYREREAFAEEVQRHYKAYEQTNSEGNSFLHEILLDIDHRVDDNDLITIIRHFKLEELIKQTINIYGETALILACMQKRFLLMEALINMASNIAIQNIECGNNVLHIAMQQQSDMGRDDVLMKALNSTEQLIVAPFIKALGSYNIRGMTPLHLAVLQNNVSVVAEVLQFCRRQNAFEVCQMGQLSDGNTIFHLAVLNRLVSMKSCILRYSEIDSFKYLINFGDYTAEELERL